MKITARNVKVTVCDGKDDGPGLRVDYNGELYLYGISQNINITFDIKLNKRLYNEDVTALIDASVEALKNVIEENGYGLISGSANVPPASTQQRKNQSVDIE